MLFTLIAEGAKGRVLAMVRLERQFSCLCTWSRMVREYAPREAYRFASLLAKLLSPRFRPDRPFLCQFLAWEKEAAAYELQARTKLPSDIKSAVIMSAAPPSFRQFLRFSSEDFSESFEKLRAAIMMFQRKSMVLGEETDEPLEVDMMKGGWSKGKGK